LARDSSAAPNCRAIQALRKDHESAVFSEICFNSEEEFAEIFEILGTLAAECGGDIEDSSAGVEPKDLRDIKMFRHAIPEMINATIAKRKIQHPGLHKVATDMAVPDEFLKPVFRLYKDVLLGEGLDFAIFGHVGNNHFHVNILPADEAQLAKAKKAYLEIAKQVVQMQGAVSAEHGIGRIKKEFLEIQYSAEILKDFAKIKAAFDPKFLMNQEVLFDVRK
jgi:D-lactate dehydrogenase (cytochrome)